MPQTKEIKDLPKLYQRIYKAFLGYLNSHNPEQARKMIRPILDLYTSMDWEVPEELEMHYARLYLLELEKEKS